MAKSSTTRRAVLSAGIAAAALPQAAQAADAGKPLLRPTELGLEMLRRLIPAHAEACWHASYWDGPEEEAVTAWDKRTFEAIRELALRTTNVVDMAIAHRVWLTGPEGEYHGNEALAVRMTAAVLALAGISEEKCSLEAYWRAQGWADREPTAEERGEALARAEREAGHAS